ncbi:GumC family protein [Planctobacterium marinum]|uniref:Uncharacterized protein n=1 Tax=Planctobacterium marinum TaxID=1631968 RepID=A0AA48KS53_9ALTE|nr:hypothetical protein MACH26_37740 [Planctobacterium marinum]
MGTAIKIPTAWDRFRGHVYRILRWPYITTGAMGYAFTFLLVALYLAQSPKFKSEMDLVLPGTGSSSNVSLNEVGQVVSQTSAPFGAGGFNPRVNYKEMLSSRGVLKRAAEKTNLPLAKFGEPKIKLTEQTSIISISITGTSSDQSQLKAWALYEALQDELDHLRADEVARRDASIKNVLAEYRERTNFARGEIVDFQQRALLVSKDQMDQLISTVAQINEKQLYVQSELVELEDYIQQLSLDLQVSPRLAGKALMLQSDPEFRGYIAELSQATTQLSEFRSRWGNKHPKVIAETGRVNVAKASLIQRGGELSGVEATNLFTTLHLDNNPKRAQLFADLIDSFARKQGKVSELQDLKRSHLHLTDQLKVYAREVAELDRLQKEFDLAEAVYTSAAARLEANKADVFASYPVVQMLTTPSFPIQQTSPNPLIAIAAGLFGVFFITFGLIVLWQRKALIQLLLKRD